MNERIRELAEQAISDVDYIRDDDFTNEELSKMYIPDCFAEKFAELIVKECAEICYHHSQAAGGVDTAFGYGYKDCGNDIKKHFGVEE